MFFSATVKKALNGNLNNKKYLSLYDIGEVLKNNNYSCLCVRLNKINDILFECITLLKVNSSSYHYVVLKRMSEKYIYFYDPLFLFIRRIRIEQFERKWSKVCLFYTKV